MQKESDVPAYSFREIYKLFCLGLIAGGYKLFKCIQNYNRERIINQRGTWTRGIVIGRGTDKVISSNYRESVTQPKSAMRLKGVLVQVDLPKGKRIIDFLTGTTSKKFYNDEEVDVWFYEHLFIVEKKKETIRCGI